MELTLDLCFSNARTFNQDLSNWDMSSSTVLAACFDMHGHLTKI